MTIHGGSVCDDDKLIIYILILINTLVFDCFSVYYSRKLANFMNSLNGHFVVTFNENF